MCVFHSGNDFDGVCDVKNDGIYALRSLGSSFRGDDCRYCICNFRDFIYADRENSGRYQKKIVLACGVHVGGVLLCDVNRLRDQDVVGTRAVKGACGYEFSFQVYALVSSEFLFGFSFISVRPYGTCDTASHASEMAFGQVLEVSFCVDGGMRDFCGVDGFFQTVGGSAFSFGYSFWLSDCVLYYGNG